MLEHHRAVFGGQQLMVTMGTLLTVGSGALLVACGILIRKVFPG